MVKNESKRLQVTLDSIIGSIDSIVAYDTGSTDETIDILKNFCKNQNIPLRLKEGEFVNFSISRNIVLEFGDSFEEIDYFLLLDCNDELLNGNSLRNFAKEEYNSDRNGYLVNQELWFGKSEKFYNIRFIKARKGWRYEGAVHEYLTNKMDKSEKELLRVPEEVVLYQDRTQDDDKSTKRFATDKKILEKEHKANPLDTRTIFYLAQTCACLENIEEAYYYYKLRTTLEGFQEEKFHSYLRAGKMAASLNLNWEVTMGWYIKAFEHSERLEPLLLIAEHYMKEQKWLLAYTFLNTCCELVYPEECILFVDKTSYEYKRWHCMGIVGYYVCKFEEGENCCRIAIEYANKNKNVDKNIDKLNLKYYVNRKSNFVYKHN